MAGKHRAPSKTGKRVAAVSAATVIPALGLTGFTGTANAQDGFDADTIASCESGGKNIYNHMYDSNPSYYSASGYFQITNSTWRANGGLKFAPTAIQATYAEQAIVAANIYKAAGNSYSDWGPSESCWSGKIGSGVTVQIEKPAEKPKPRAEKTVVAPKPKAEKKAAPRAEKVAPKNVATSNATSPMGVFTPGGTGTYTVKSGDTLTSIAKANGTTVAELVNVNKNIVEHPDWIFTGERLVIK